MFEKIKQFFCNHKKYKILENEDNFIGIKSEYKYFVITCGDGYFNNMVWDKENYRGYIRNYCGNCNKLLSRSFYLCTNIKRE